MIGCDLWVAILTIEAVHLASSDTSQSSPAGALAPHTWCEILKPILMLNLSQTLLWSPCKIGLLLFSDLLDGILKPAPKVDPVRIACEGSFFSANIQIFRYIKDGNSWGQQVYFSANIQILKQYRNRLASDGREEQVYFSACSLIRVTSVHSVPAQIIMFQQKQTSSYFDTITREP